MSVGIFHLSHIRISLSDKILLAKWSKSKQKAMPDSSFDTTLLVDLLTNFLTLAMKKQHDGANLILINFFHFRPRIIKRLLVQISLKVFSFSFFRPIGLISSKNSPKFR